MQPEKRSSWDRFWWRPAFLQAAATLGAVLLAEAGALGIASLLERRGILLAPALRWLSLAVLALLAGLIAGLWINRQRALRLARILESSRLWLRGNLSRRIADSARDDLGRLAGQLDSLAGHLEKDERDLTELRERNTRLADQVRLLAVVEERNRLARELHDGVKQHLFSVAMTASAIRARLDELKSSGASLPPDLAEMAAEVEGTARAAQREMAHLIEDLRPVTIQDQGLAAALNHYSLLFGAREHLLVYVDVQGEDRSLPPSVAESLYRVAQEALHNIARHARATRVDLTLRCLPEQASLVVRDNGIGFDAGQPARGLGLSNMRERMLALGGSLKIESHPGEGATILADTPIPRQAWLPSEIECQEEPLPSIRNWAWLGQRLVIPVGQTWPWHPADEMHLRQPLVEPGPGPLVVRRKTGLFGSRVVIYHSGASTPVARLRRAGQSWAWEIGNTTWAFLPAGVGKEHMILTRNHLPLAALQEKRRPLNAWSEIVYDGHGYCLRRAQEQPLRWALTSEDGVALLSAELDPLPRITLSRSLPYNLLIMVAIRMVEEVVNKR
jgi:NarL family two-component system sensor histidine kinase LiaS